MSRRPWMAVLAGSVVGLTISMVMTDIELDDAKADTTRLELQLVEADEREVVMAERLIRLTEGMVAQREVIDRLSAACVAAGDCVASDETGDTDG